MDFGPGVGGFLFDPVVHQQIAADIACRDAVRARGTDEDMRVILAYAVTVLHRFLGSGGRVRAPGLIGDPLADQARQRVEEIERCASLCSAPLPAGLAQQRAQLAARTGQRGLAQEAPQGQMARMASDHPGIVFGLDDAFADHRHLARARLHPDQRDMVEVLVVIDKLRLRVFEVHLPFDDALALGFLGGQPQPLERVHHRLGKGVMRCVPDREGQCAHAWNL